jgi:hypothetical protein
MTFDVGAATVVLDANAVEVPEEGGYAMASPVREALAAMVPLVGYI